MGQVRLLMETIAYNFDGLVGALMRVNAMLDQFRY